MNAKIKPFFIFMAIIFGFSLTLILLWSLSHVPTVYAAAITVNTPDDELNSDGDCSLREAIRAANLDTAVDACSPGSGADEITFALTTPAIITLTQGQLVIENDPLTLTGPGAAQLTLSGNGAARIFDVAGSAPVTLTAMTLRDGATSGSGGAVRSESALTVANVVLLANTASGDGGAIDVAGNLTLTGSEVLSNTASGEGGGVKAGGGTFSTTNGRFAHNHSGSFGGGLYANGPLTIDGTDFVGNTANSYAGAVWAWGAATIANADFSANAATYLDAGAVYARFDLHLTATTFISNTAGGNVGALWANQDVTMTDATFSENAAGTGRSGAMEINGSLWMTNTQWISNTAAQAGGALVLLGDNGRFVNSLFARNVGGAATLKHGGDVTILHATFVAADAATDPALAINTAGSVTVQNAIFSRFPTGLAVTQGTVSEDYNLFHETTAVSGPVTRGDSSYHGDAAFVDAAGGDYHLSAHSEALNTGTDAGIGADLDGDARPGGSGIDLGYDETAHVADAAMSKTAVSSPGPGQPIEYRLAFSNAGTAMLPRLTITDRLPAQIVGSIEISSSVPITAVGGVDPYVWQVHNLAPGAGGVITISGVLSDVLPHTEIVNEASISAIATETNTANNSDSAGVTAPNVAPVAVNDTATIAEDAVTIFHPTLNDIDGDTLTIESVTPPGHGTATISSTQQIVYTPTLEYSGPDEFSYTVSDGLSSDTATVAITVTAVNDAPIISAGDLVTVTMSEDGAPTPFSLTLHGSDAESSPLTWSVTGAAANGAASAAAGPANNSAIGYTPDADYFGTDQFTVQVSDGEKSDSVTVSVTVAAVNDAPRPVDDTAVVLRQPSGDLKVLAGGSTGSLNVLDNDVDVEDDALTVTAVDTPDQGGTVTLGGSGALQSYTPADGFVGLESFGYAVADYEVAATAVVSLTVTGGMDGGIGGDAFTVNGIGRESGFNVTTDIPNGVANGDNAAFVFNEPQSGPALVDAASPAAPPGFVPTGLTFTLDAYLDGQRASGDYQFAEPITFIVDYANSDLTEIGPSEQSLGLFFWHDGDWSDGGVHIVNRDDAQNRLTVTVNHAGTFSLFRHGFVFLPLAMRNYVQAPDLIVESVTVLDGGATGVAGDVEVVIKNVGNGAVTDEFWVDLYVDPHTPPTAVNQTWEMLGDEGLVWGVLADALPLYPGDSLTLTLAGPYFAADFSHVHWPLPADVPIYAQVDSSDTATTTGAVLEMHELSGAPYNNISGPH